MTSRLRRHRWLILALLVLLALLLFSGVALARPGGGHSYSGGSRSRSRSSGGGGDGGVLFDLFFLLVIEHPSVGIPLLLLLLIAMLVRVTFQSRMKAWSTAVPQLPAVSPPPRRPTAARLKLSELRTTDPDFSLVLFEDFVYLLYAAIQRARAFGTAPLAPYLAPDLASALQSSALADVNGIVIGALRYVDSGVAAEGGARVELEVEANYVEVLKSGVQHRYYVVDRLALSRTATAKSRPFARATKLDCPNCGAPLEAMQGTECSYCRQQVGFGRFDWLVTSLAGISREPRGPLLTSEVGETGTELPTIVDPRASQRFAELQQRDPSLSWQGFTARLAHVFAELQGAWSGRDPLRIRPYVSDNQFQSLLYWIDLYVAARCRNISENARILRVDLASVTSDKHYDAITVRLFASSVDYTISDDGKLLSGNRSRPRAYSEYWTWIRGTSRRGSSRGDTSCPNCGASLRIGMAGTCEYCRVKVTAGEFDWVLSRIEQDDSYTG